MPVTITDNEGIALLQNGDVAITSYVCLVGGHKFPSRISFRNLKPGIHTANDDLEIQPDHFDPDNPAEISIILGSLDSLRALKSNVDCAIDLWLDSMCRAERDATELLGSDTKLEEETDEEHPTESY